jgi:hypothetical protein
MMRSEWSFVDVWYAIIWRPMVILQNLAEEEDLLRSVTSGRLSSGKDVRYP